MVFGDIDLKMEKLIKFNLIWVRLLETFQLLIIEEITY